MPQFKAALLYDDDLRAAANTDSRNYWPVYYSEILRRMGLPHTLVSAQQLTTDSLADYAVLLLPPLPDGYLTREHAGVLTDWVSAGGLLIAFATPGLDDLFGITVEGTIAQADDEYTASACIRLADEQFTKQLLLPYDQGAALPVLAPVQQLAAPDCREIARLLSFFEQDLHRPAVTYRTIGSGAACYWAFDIAECTWKMHQGRPVYEDYDGDGSLRTMDMVPTRPWTADVPYADLMMFTLRRIIAEHGGVFIHQLPPCDDGSIPDAVFHWGGDDEGVTDVQIPATEFMVQMNLPYHINIMQAPIGTHQLSKKSFDRLKQLGCETSIHFNFTTAGQQPYHITRQDLADQLDTYYEAYGEVPVCTVFHCMTWTGWAEPARWLADLGLKGDNNKAHWRYPPSNPVNKCNFAFGTSYPSHYWDDYTRDNRRIEFTSQPVTAYECGYTPQATEFSQLHRAIELAKFWNLTMNLFFHPVYLTRAEPRAAVKEAFAHIEKLGMTAAHLGTDGLCLWWHERDKSAIEAIERDERNTTIRTHTAYPAGCIVQMLCPQDEPETVQVNGRPAQFVIREQHGTRWLYVAMPTGQAEAAIAH